MMKYILIFALFLFLTYVMIRTEHGRLLAALRCSNRVEFKQPEKPFEMNKVVEPLLTVFSVVSKESGVKITETTDEELERQLELLEL